MAIFKKREQQTESRLLLESFEPVELPPAEVEESALVVQFENAKPYIPELLETLRAGTVAELVPVMIDGSTFAIHTATRTFWVKLWHSSPERTRVERAQILSCLPSTRGVHVVFADDDEEWDEEDDDADDVAEEANDELTDETRAARDD